MRELLLLLLVLGLASTQVGSPLVDYLLMPFLVTLVATHLDRESGRLSRVIVKTAARLLPVDRREDERDEWLDHIITAGEEGVLPLTRALSVAFIAAPALAIGLRVGRSRRHSAR